MERALSGTPSFDICKGNHLGCLQKEDTCRFPHIHFPPKRRQSYETLQGLQVQRKAWSVATCLALGTKYISIRIKQQFFLSNKIQAPSGKICFRGFTGCHGRPRCTRFSGQCNHCQRISIMLSQFKTSNARLRLEETSLKTQHPPSVVMKLDVEGRFQLI